MNNAVKTAKARGLNMRGRGKLTNERIAKWGSYYRYAITESSSAHKLAVKRVWAILEHNASTPEKPRNENCD